MTLFRLGLLVFLSSFVVSCTGCSFQREETPGQYSYLCLPTNSKVSMAVGMQAQTQALGANGLSQNDGELKVTRALKNAWFIGARIHLDERFNELGKRGYRFVGISMYDPEFGAIWVCFEKKALR